MRSQVVMVMRKGWQSLGVVEASYGERVGSCAARVLTQGRLLWALVF